METSPTVHVRRNRLRWWLLLVSGLAVLVGSVLAMVFGLFKQDRIGPANYRIIQMGMTVQEAEDVLGREWPPNRTPFPYGWSELVEEGTKKNIPPQGVQVRVWVGKDYAVVVNAEPDSHRIYYKYIGALVKPGPWERIKTYLHLDNLF